MKKSGMEELMVQKQEKMPMNEKTMKIDEQKSEDEDKGKRKLKMTK